MKSKFLICGVIFLAFAYALNAQDDPSSLITGAFEHVQFEEAVRQIEDQTGYRFYFDPARFDSMVIDAPATERNLEDFLHQLLDSAGMKFNIDDRKRVYITSETEIRTTLPVDFFERTESAGEYDAAFFDYMWRRDEGDKLQNTLENKLFEIGPKTNTITEGKATLAGYLRDEETGEPIIGALVYIDNPRIGAATDQYGYYSITLPKGRHEALIKSIGMKNTKRQIVLYGDGKLDIELRKDIIPLKEVIIESEKDINVAGMQMGLERLDIRAIKQAPTALGEVDVLKVALTLPGVQSVGESSAGLNVRGGAVDQNLVLFNDAVVYNPTHLFGFFSAFNPDALKNVELYKSGIPAQYGGRLSSVLEVTGREGNRKELAGSGGIGLITGRFTLEGPVIKDKASFLIGARSTYSDWLLGLLSNKALKDSDGSFYDVNAQMTYDINERNSVYLTGYFSADRFQLNSDTLYRYNNRNISMKWKRVFNNKFYSVLTGGVNNYSYSVFSDANPVNAFDLNYEINQTNLKLDFNYFPASQHTIDFGFSGNLYTLSPGSLTPAGTESLVKPDIVQKESGLESAVYIGDQFDVTQDLSLYLGLRYSMFQALGPREVYEYPDGLPKTESNITDTTFYGKNEVFSTYHGPEYRFSARYSLSNDLSVKFSFNRMRQYLHMLSNTTAISPTDIWKLSDRHIKPQVGDQYAIGVYKNFKNNTIETSLEAYYKTMDDFLDYKSGAELILNKHLETDVINARGKAYGVEAMIKKSTGKLNGWMSYTYSRSLLQIDEPETGERINQGEYFPSNYDKPHDFTLIGNYKVNRRFSISLNLTYSTGRPITLPLAKYSLQDAQRLYYSDRNKFRIPDYFRADFSMNIEGNHKVSKLAHSSWTIAVYNLTGRKNAYSVYFTSDGDEVKGYRLSIFGQPVPSITYNFKF